MLLSRRVVVGYGSVAFEVVVYVCVAVMAAVVLLFVLCWFDGD